MADRAIRFLLQAGVILVVVVALPYKIFELDRYFVPKELVLNVAALLIAVLLLTKLRSLSFDLVDGLLALFLLWSAASSVFATNYWLAQRSLGVSVAGVVSSDALSGPESDSRICVVPVPQSSATVPFLSLRSALNKT